MSEQQSANKDEYKMEDPGKMIIFNQENFEPETEQVKRIGSSKDAERLKKLFTEFGFGVETYIDSTAQEIENIISRVAAEEQEKISCLFIVVLTHGDNNGILFAKDKRISVEKILDHFESSQWLRNIPKIFIFQACRGGLYEQKVEYQFDCIKSVELNQMPTKPHFLLAFSTVENYVSARSEQEGSLYIKALCEELNKAIIKRESNACNNNGEAVVVEENVDILKILQRVCHSVASKRLNDESKDVRDVHQTPYYESTLLRKLYLKRKKPTQSS